MCSCYLRISRGQFVRTLLSVKVAFHQTSFRLCTTYKALCQTKHRLCATLEAIWPSSSPGFAPRLRPSGHLLLASRHARGRLATFSWLSAMLEALWLSRKEKGAKRKKKHQQRPPPAWTASPLVMITRVRLQSVRLQELYISSCAPTATLFVFWCCWAFGPYGCHSLF